MVDLPHEARASGAGFGREGADMTASAGGRVFTTTSTQGLRQGLPPMRLWHKAKKLGTWDPRDIDFSRDVTDWDAMSERQRDALARHAALFLAGQQPLTLDLLPLIMAVARAGRIEEEMYLPSFVS